jgi:hypothetical protein
LSALQTPPLAVPRQPSPTVWVKNFKVAELGKRLRCQNCRHGVANPARVDALGLTRAPRNTHDFGVSAAHPCAPRAAVSAAGAAKFPHHCKFFASEAAEV